MIPKLRFFALLILAALPSACCQLTPKTCDLEAVHAMYREEFPSSILPKSNTATQNTVKLDARFDGTLAAIREFGKKHGEDSSEFAHLLVLKGMIYLQSGRPAMARLVAPQIAEARSKLDSGTGAETRDQLFADAFPHLLTGWEEITDFVDLKPATVAEFLKIDAAAKGIDEILNEDSRDFASVEADSGAIYLANTAAIFYLWAYKLGKQTATPDTVNSPTPTYYLTAADEKKYAAKGRDLMKGFLAPEEATAVANGTYEGLAMTQDIGRVRYLAWYAKLEQLAK